MKLRLIMIIFASLLASACTNRIAPAPVVNVSSSQTSLKQKINISGNSYRVNAGDTLYSIAFHAKKDFREIARINGITKPFVIFPGQIIQLKETIKKTKSKRIYSNKKPKSTNKLQKNNKTLKKPLDQKKQQEYVEKQASLKSAQKAKAKTGTLVWQWPTKGQLITRFSNKENGYKGIQIKNKAGTAILAAADGLVVYAGSALRGYGQLIIVQHNDDYLSAYAHNRKLLVKEKQKVSAGQKIAEMGNTDSKTTALRFEVRFKGNSVNPLKYLPR